MAYRPQYKNKSGKMVDLPIDAATVNGKTAIVEGDSRLTDARTPKSHTHTKSQITDFPVVLTGGSQTTTSSADGGSNVYTFAKSDGSTSTLTIKNGSKGSTGPKGDIGATGPQGPKGDIGATGPQGPKGAAGVGVSSISQTTTSTSDAGTNVITCKLTDGTTTTFNVKNGSKGSTGATGAKGAEGLGIFRSSSSTSTGTTSITKSTITIPTGRSIKVGDLIIANSTYSYLYRVTAVNSSTVTVTYLTSLRGATGATGATGGSTFSRTQLKLIMGDSIDIDNASGWNPYAYKQLLIITDQGAFWWTTDRQRNTNVVRDENYYYWFDYDYNTDDEGTDWGYLMYYRATGTGSASTYNTSIYIFGV